MTKILYNFDSISTSLESLNGSLELINALESSISSLSVDVPELSGALNSAKKTTIENINNIAEILTDSIKKVQNLCDAYQEYESSKSSNDTLLNKEFPIKEVVSSTNYEIKYGDTLSAIAKKQNVTVDAIVEANKDKITDENLIYAGDTIVIPGVNSATTEETEINNSKTVEEKVVKTVKEETEDIDTTNSVNLSSGVSVGNYNSNSTAGFNVTYDNKTYSLTVEEKDLLYAIVAAECDKSPDDALAVVSTILNRCENSAWVNSHGTNPISQATAPNQYVVYQHGYYKNYINGNAPETVKTAVDDALNGVRNCSYLSFRSNSSTSYSNNMISNTGNRYK